MLVWRRPWMTLAGDTYGSSLLAAAGLLQRLHRPAVSATPWWNCPTPPAASRTLVLLPTEPYPFKERHVAEVAEAIPDAAVAIVDGQDLFWWGIRTPGAVERLAGALSGR